MAALNFLLVLFAAVLFQSSRASHPGFDVAIKTHNAPESSDADTILALRQSLASIQKREDQSDFKEDITLQKSWENAVLLFLGSEPDDNDDDSDSPSLPLVEVVCTKCYINGLATAELKFDSGFNISKVFEDTAHEVSNELKNISHAAVDWAEDVFHTAVENITKFEFDDLTLPPFNVSLDVDIESIPAASLQFSFEEFELFMQIRTKLAAASIFTIPLLDPSISALSGTSIDLGVGVLGVFFTADLILDFDTSLDITSGIHIKLDDGVSFEIDLFGDKPSEIAVNGGQFEFLPVTVSVNSATFSAILRVGAHAGLNVNVGKFGAGLEAAVFADVAKIVTNITATPDDAVCKLPMSQEYSFELGADIGATLTFHDVTFGPVAETFIPIWYTTMTGMCANEAETTSVSSATASSSALGRRDDLETTVITTKITHTGVSCPQTLGPNCPLSLRSTTQYTETRSLTTAVPSGGEEATFPVSTYDTVSTEAFGSNVQKLASSSGSPASYIEPTPTSMPSGDSNANGEKTGSGSHAATCNVVLPLTFSLLALVVMTAFVL